MDLYLTCFILAAGFSIVNGDFRYEHFNTFSFHGNDNPSRKPWFLDDYSDYTPESSRTVYHYAYPYDDNVKHGSIHIPTYKKYSPYSDSYYSSTKKIPNEDKAFKKAISPFYTITDKDSIKYKKLVLKSGLPYCREIKSKGLDDKVKHDQHSDDSKTIKREAMTCYKCKDPKNGSTYEQCSYSSEPQASTNIEKFERGPLRFRRSNEEFDSSEEESAPAVSLTATKDEKLKEPYRFSEEYFLPQASRKISTEQKSDLCERVVKDSMICMVCKDPKTNGKYEQCSYVAEPNEKAYAYTKSSSFGEPKKPEKSGNLKKRDHREPAPTHESLESSEYGDEKVSEERPRQLKDATGNSECKQVQRDSEICTVCKDPKTGGNSERCSYAYNPDDKVYKFTKSKSFGYPESDKSDKSSSYEDDESDKEVSESDPKESTSYSDDDPYDYSGYQKPKEASSYESQESPSSYGADESKDSKESKESQTYDYYPASADYIKSESEKILKDAESTNCKKIQKDSMICTVCKDPKTGGNSESCSYSYQPEDKKFAYTKSKSFGSPTENRGGNKESEESNPYGSSEYSDDAGYYGTEHKPVAYQSGKQETADSKTQAVISNQSTTQAPISKVDLEFLSTSKRKAEIEKFLKEFQAEDRTKCQKVMKDKMTCYRCRDETGVQKEECMFITAPANKTKNRVSYRESKKFKLDLKPKVAATSEILKRKRQATKVKENSSIPLEPAFSASEDSYTRTKETKNKNPEKDEDDDVDENDDQNGENYGENNDYRDQNDHKDTKYKDGHMEVKPHEYVAETKYKYDKVLGLTLPAYMLETSEFEKEFDEIYTGGRSSS
ncbi:protein starmaker [Belonocnema kinseyi]|uniref:protein starmaker n=1 Tax=Belonocnema kinseyi TaxID=2817044 RepID=UPI00143CD479|nr:protein starmaker [Belonocnema kinseyi]